MPTVHWKISPEDPVRRNAAGGREYTMREEQTEDAFQRQLASKVQYCERTIREFLPAEVGYAGEVVRAMNYSVLAGGKRLRPLILHETAVMYGAGEDLVRPFMAAIEMIHTYSLVHDDLPAMDNDEYRRGQKTTWAVYGEAMAILAGDGLLNYAYETAMRAFDAVQDEEERCRAAKALIILARNAGIHGMVGGQCADIQTDRDPDSVDEEMLHYIHRKKTACMIESAFQCGAVLAGAPKEDIGLLGQIALDVGLAFQIQDDILDVVGSKDELGKSTGKDEQEGKLTYVSVFGLEESKARVKELTEHARESFDDLSESSEFLEALVMHLMTRRK